MMHPKWMNLGWLFFTTAGVVWILPFGIYWLIQGRFAAGAAGMALSPVAVAAILALAPWKFPDTRLWKLLIPPYVFFLAAVWLVVYVYAGFQHPAAFQYGLWLVPCFVPFFTFGWRTWRSLSRPP